MSVSKDHPFYRTDEEIKRTALMDHYVDQFQLFGFHVKLYHDVSLSNHSIWEVEGKDFYKANEAYEYAKKLFLETKFEGPAYKHEVYMVCTPDWNNDGLLRYQGGFYGGYYNSEHDIYKAKWFNSLEEVFDFLKKYCYRDGAMIKEYTKPYLQSIVDNELALEQIKKTHC